MSKNRISRPRGSDSKEEALRGKNRELHKTIKQLQQKIAQLENQLDLGSTIKKEKFIEDKPKINANQCDMCGKGTMKTTRVPKPGGDLIFVECDICQNRKRIK